MKRYYAYEILPSGAESYHAFLDDASRWEWMNEKPDCRWGIQRRDMTRPQIRQALWWTETPIGAAISAHSTQK